MNYNPKESTGKAFKPYTFPVLTKLTPIHFKLPVPSTRTTERFKLPASSKLLTPFEPSSSKLLVSSKAMGNAPSHLAEEGQLWKPTEAEIKAIYKKFDIPRDITIQALDESCDVKNDIGLRTGEIFFSYMALPVTRFSLDFIT